MCVDLWQGMCIFMVYSFFFFKQKTAYKRRISDWSSDGCSSDLALQAQAAQHTDGGVERDVLQRAAAVLLEGLLDGRARPPVGGEGVVGVDREGLVGGGGRQRREARAHQEGGGGCKESEKAHASLHSSYGAAGFEERGARKACRSNPSAGITRVRFIGLSGRRQRRAGLSAPKGTPLRRLEHRPRGRPRQGCRCPHTSTGGEARGGGILL